MSKEASVTIVKPQSALALWVKMHIYVVAAGAFAIFIAVIAFYFYVLKPSYEAGSLHIKDIVPVKELKSWQSELDMLVNMQSAGNHNFTALVTTKMVAGVKMQDVQIDEDANTIHVRVPQATLLSLESSSEKMIRENGLDQPTIDAAKSFSNAYAKNILKHEHRLATAQQEAVRIIQQFVKVVADQKHKKAEVVAEPMADEAPQVTTMRSTRTPLYLRHFPLMHKWKAKVFPPESGRYALYEWENQSTKIAMYAIGMITGNNGPVAPYQCNGHESNWAQQFNPLNVTLPFGMQVNPSRNSAKFCWQAGKQVYEMDFNAVNSLDYKEKLPDAMMLAYGVRYNADFQFDKGKSYTLGGIARKEWLNVPFFKKTAYFLNMLAQGQTLKLKLGFWNEKIPVFIEGKGTYNSEDIEDLWNKIHPSEQSKIKVILYDPEEGVFNGRKQRLIALSPKKIYFVVSTAFRQVPINFLKLAVRKEVRNISRDSDGEWQFEGEYFNVSIHSERFNQLLDAIAHDEIFDMISWEP